MDNPVVENVERFLDPPTRRSVKKQSYVGSVTMPAR